MRCRLGTSHTSYTGLIRTGENGFTGCGFTSVDTLSSHAAFWLIERYHAQGGLRLLFDRQLSSAILGPLYAHKAALFGDDALKLFVRFSIVRVLLTKCQRALIESFLHLFQQFRETLLQHIDRHNLFGTIITAHQHHALVLRIAWADLNAHRHAAHLPLVKFPTRCILATVYSETHLPFKHLFDTPDRLFYQRFLGILAPDRHHYGLIWGQAWRQDQTRLIAMDHDDTPDHARAEAPTGGSAIFALSIGIQKLNIEASGEIVTQVMAGSGLQCLAVTHQRLDRIGAQRTRELLVFALDSGDNWDSGILFGKGTINL